MIQSLENFVSMAIQGTQVPMAIQFFFLFICKKKNKAKLKNNQTKTCETTWKHERKMQMHESMIPKAYKKSSKESLALDRKN